MVKWYFLPEMRTFWENIYDSQQYEINSFEKYLFGIWTEDRAKQVRGCGEIAITIDEKLVQKLIKRSPLVLP